MNIDGKKLLAILAIPPLLFAVGFGLLLLFLVVLVGGPSSVILVPQPTNVTPSEGIPPDYVQAAAEDAEGKVSLQYLAGEVQTESGWDPTANANVNDPNSHAAGLMQFEPETWSGSTDPFMTIEEPDTDADRILQYYGYGRNADGLWEPIGTPAEETLGWLQQNNQPHAKGYVPYASPYDPFDALLSGMGYLYRLYRWDGSWSMASRSYYGGTNWYKYVQTVWQYAYDYLADTTPLIVSSGSEPEYFFLGSIPFEQKVRPFGETARNGLWDLSATVNETAVLRRPFPSGLMPPDEYRVTLENEFVTSVPLIAPESGIMVWRRQKNGTVNITLPFSKKKSLYVTAWQAIPWTLPRYGGKTEVKAGDVVGFVNLLSGIEVKNLKDLYPAIHVTGYITSVVNGRIVQTPDYDPSKIYTSKYTIHDPWWPFPQ